jgi:hypothetical protein
LLLPLHAAAFGITLPEAGLLLAANRIVRVFGHHWVAAVYATRGPRAACLFAAAGAVLSTLGYAVCSGVWPLFVARFIWGLAFAAMNIANQAFPTSHLSNAPQQMGRARSIVSGDRLAHRYGARRTLVLPSMGAARCWLYWGRPSPFSGLVYSRR